MPCYLSDPGNGYMMHPLLENKERYAIPYLQRGEGGGGGGKDIF